MPAIDLRFSRDPVNVFPGRQFKLSLSIHVKGNVEYLMLRLWSSKLSRLEVALPKDWCQLPPNWTDEPDRVMRPAAFLKPAYQDHFGMRARAIRSGGNASGLWLVPPSVSPGDRASLELAGVLAKDLPNRLPTAAYVWGEAWADFEESYYYGVQRNAKVGHASVKLVVVATPNLCDDSVETEDLYDGSRALTNEEWKQKYRRERMLNRSPNDGTSSEGNGAA